MKRLRTAARVTICPFCICCAAAFAEDIAVRVISVKNGRPLVERHIQLYVARIVEPPDKSSPQLFNEWQYTDSAGVALFHVAVPIPPGAWLTVGGIADCCSPAHYDVAKVLRTGVSEPRPCPHRPMKKIAIPARPGEIVMYSGEYSRWERTLYFPWPS